MLVLLPKIEYEVVLFGPDGPIVKQSGRQPCRSYVKNYYNYLLSAMAYAPGASSLDLHQRSVDGVVRSWTYPWYVLTEDGGYSWIAPTGDDTIGIVVGSSNEAENFGMGSSPGARSYSLGNKILNGDSAGRLNYDLMSTPQVEKSGSSPQIWTITHQRYFNNASGGNVTIREIGMQRKNIPNFSYNVLCIRDVLTAEYTVAHGGQFLVKFIFTLTIPSAI